MHTYFFAILPLCWIYIKNCDELPLQHIVIIAIALGIITTCINGFLSRICKKTYQFYWPLISLGWVLFWYSIPVARNLANSIMCYIPPIILTYKWSLAMICVFILGIIASLAFRILQKKLNFTKLNSILNVWVICISCFLVGQSVWHYFHIKSTKPFVIKSQNIEKHPNIYHIILDAYTNYRVLQETYGYDNSDFYNALEQLGFVCQKDSHSDYSGTYLSMSSVLNWGCQHPDKLLDQDTYFHHKLKLATDK